MISMMYLKDKSLSNFTILITLYAKMQSFIIKLRIKKYLYLNNAIYAN